MARTPNISNILPDSSNLPDDWPSDSAILEQIGRHDQAALAQLYDRHSARIFALALRLLGDPHLAEEITQDVFLRIWQRADTFQPSISSALAWMMAITRNRSIDELRSRRATMRRQETTDLLESLATDSADPPQQAEDQLLAQDVRAALQDLPQRQRRAVELAIFGGMSHSEIALALHTPLGTIKSWLRQGLQQLRGSLGENWPQHEE